MSPSRYTTLVPEGGLGLEPVLYFHGSLVDDDDFIEGQASGSLRNAPDFPAECADVETVFSAGPHLGRSRRRKIPAQVADTLVPVLSKSLYDGDLGIVHRGGFFGKRDIRGARPGDDDLRQDAIDVQHGVYDNGFTLGRTE